MKPKLIIFVFVSLLLGAGYYNNEHRYIDDDYKLMSVKYNPTAGRDSIFIMSFDTLKSYLTAQGFGSSDGSKQLINDSLSQDTVYFGSEILVPDCLHIGATTLSTIGNYLECFWSDLFWNGNAIIDGEFDATGESTFDSDVIFCLLYTSPSPRDGLLSRMPSSA